MNTTTSSATTEQATPARKPYNPTYDPLMDRTPGEGENYAPTYWIGTAGEPPADDGPISGDVDVDVVIIGSGFTGLNAAIALGRDYGIKATVLEANRVAWGCSTRNGGQAQCATGRLSRSQWIQRWGLDVAKRMHQECVDAFEYFESVIADIECERVPGGHWYIAHKPRVMAKLEKEAKLLRETFNYDCKIFDAATVKRDVVDDKEGAGAMLEPLGTGIHAGKLAYGYLRKARALGATVHPASPVIGWETRDGVHHLKTPGGTVRARAVGVATGGYTGQFLHKEFKNRLMPILSNSITTRPLTDDEVKEAGIHTHSFFTDTRILRHYYRLMPDNSLQIGSRSAITGRNAPDKKYENMLIADMHRKFPSLKDVEVKYSWWGWVDVSHDMMPRIVQPDSNQTIYYSVGYGGNGVMYSAQAGRRLAMLIAGQPDGAFDLPIFRDRLPFPNVREMVSSEFFAPYRRFGQWWLYRWYYVKDEML